MIEIKITNASPLGVLAELAAMAAYQLTHDDVRSAADRIIKTDRNEAHEGFPLESAPAPAPTPPPAQPTAAETPQPVTAAPVAPPPAYTMPQLQAAVGPLVDAGHGPALVELLQKYGVAKMYELGAEQLGAFAADLRALGARL